MTEVSATDQCRSFIKFVEAIKKRLEQARAIRKKENREKILRMLSHAKNCPSCARYIKKYLGGQTVTEFENSLREEWAYLDKQTKSNSESERTKK